MTKWQDCMLRLKMARPMMLPVWLRVILRMLRHLFMFLLWMVLMLASIGVMLWTLIKYQTLADVLGWLLLALVGAFALLIFFGYLDEVVRDIRRNRGR